MKKILCIFLVFAVCLFSCTAGKVLNYNGVGVIQVYADDESNNDSEEDDEGFFEGISNALSNIANTIEQVIDAMVSLVNSDKNVAAPLLISCLKSMFETLAALWNGLMDAVVADDLFNSNTLFGNGHMIANIATSLATYSFGIWSMGLALELKGEIRRSEDGELTLKRFTNCLARSFPSLILIICSYWICKCIVYINEGMVSVVADNFPSIDELFETLDIDEDSFGEGMGIGLIGYLFDLIDGIIKVLPMYVAMLVLIIIGWCVDIKLKMRQIEVCCMIAISPLFFACAGYESMQEYFKKFIMTFLSVVAQTLFMAIVILVGMTWFNDEVLSITGDTGFLFLGGDRSLADYLGDVFIIIAMGIMLLKPPAVLQNLVKA